MKNDTKKSIFSLHFGGEDKERTKERTREREREREKERERERKRERERRVVKKRGEFEQQEEHPWGKYIHIYLYEFQINIIK